MVTGGSRIGKLPSMPGLPAGGASVPSSSVRDEGGMTVRGVSAVAVALAFMTSGSAAAETITVTPSSSHPGDRVHISVPGCGTGPTAHVAISRAFTGNVTLFGKADTGDADPTIRQELKPGVYPITAYCGSSTVQGQISITAGDRSTGGSGLWPLLVVVLVIAGVAGAFVFGRRRSSVS
jgi:hypothetical protein